MKITILKGDCREILPVLPDQSVHCVVTSPPYFGLRDYGTATWQGGDAECDHRRFNGYPTNVVGTTDAQDNGKFFKDTCGKCGAICIDSQIGLEPTPQAYVEQLVAVFREVRRVLRDDGTLWLNLGDSYAGGGLAGSAKAFNGKQGTNRGSVGMIGRPLIHDCKAKDLIGIPWRVAFALQADGWWLRQDIIWSKPNPMPESVTDRCTKAHEYMFLLSKNARYYYDAEAIAEAGAAILPNGKTAPRAKYGGVMPSEARYGVYHSGLHGQRSSQSGTPLDGGRGHIRNKRSVWEIATQPYSEAHFATFPPALIEPCIKAGCPKDGTVLDPFSGAGTTGLVADCLGRNAVLIELNSDYAAMSERRIIGDAGMFAQVDFDINPCTLSLLETWSMDPL